MSNIKKELKTVLSENAILEKMCDKLREKVNGQETPKYDGAGSKVYSPKDR